MKRLGFDFNWNSCVETKNQLFPVFEKQVLEDKPDGSRVVRDEQGLIVLEKPGVVSISAEIGTSLMDRRSWEELYLPRLKWSEGRVDREFLKRLPALDQREIPIGIHCGSLLG